MRAGDGEPAAQFAQDGDRGAAAVQSWVAGEQDVGGAQHVHAEGGQDQVRPAYRPPLTTTRLLRRASSCAQRAPAREAG